MRRSNKYFSILAFLCVMLFLSQAMAQDGAIYRWNGNRWEKTNGQGLNISVGPDNNPWVTTSSKQISTRRRNSWDRINGTANDIGVGSDGTVWITGTKYAARGDFEIFRRNNNRWEKMPGGGVRIAAESYDSAWLVNSQNAIWRFINNAWERIPDGEAYDVGVGSDGTAWIIGTNKVGNGDFGVYRRNGNRWEEMPGGGVRIAVESFDSAWLINAEGYIWRFTGSTWQKMSGKGQDIGVGSDGSVWVVGTPQ